jgi:hypothetical protein
VSADKSEPTEEQARAARFRSRAGDLRAMAVNGLDPSIKAALLQVANDYELMAQTMESTDLTNLAIAADRKHRD